MSSSLADLQRRYDGPIPEAERDALRYGSQLAALIAGEHANVRFYRDMIVKNRRSARAWFMRGNREMTENNRRDGWIYLTGWRAARQSLRRLEAEQRVAEGTRRTLDGIAAMLGGR